MTTLTATTAQSAAPIIGPLSAWPRKTRRLDRRFALLACGAGGIGVFLHCVAPMLF